MKISAIIEPSKATDDLPTVVGSRMFNAVDDFVGAVGSAAGAAVQVIEGSISDAPADGYLIVFSEAGIAENPSLASRIVLVNADRSTLSRNVEKYQLVCAIEKHRYFCWKSNRGDEDGSGIVGRKDVAEILNAEILEGPYTSNRYGWLASTAFADLPSLLAGYLAAHHALEGRRVSEAAAKAK